jgi:hypothetical protein
MFSDEVQVRCPVGNNILGTRNKKELCTFLCNDCQFLFTWNSKGVLLPPTKYKKEKPVERCGCATCGR